MNMIDRCHRRKRARRAIRYPKPTIISVAWLISRCIGCCHVSVGRLYPELVTVIHGANEYLLLCRIEVTEFAVCIPNLLIYRARREPSKPIGELDAGYPAAIEVPRHSAQ